MFDFLDNPLVFALVSLGITFGALFMVYLEMPPKIVKKTGATRSIVDRVATLGRTGKVFLFVFVVSMIGTIASFVDLFNG